VIGGEYEGVPRKAGIAIFLRAASAMNIRAKAVFSLSDALVSICAFQRGAAHNYTELKTKNLLEHLQ
jgi:predicted nucleic acid-binding protein